jgi:Protein tyrosine and serine/threonine kinase
MAHGAASNTFTRIGRPFSILDTTTTTPQGPNLLSVLSAAQALHVPIMPITWQRARPEFERGGTSNINQTTINAKVSLAFKYVKKEGHPKIEDEMKRMIREITVLGQPAIRNCPNIVQLEGICWYIREQRIWPALVFEKADYGDLATFCKSSLGEHLSMHERLKLCMDIGNAVFYMHNHSK